MVDNRMGVDSLCVHAGLDRKSTNALTMPIYQTSSFRFDSASHGARLFSGEEKGYIYSRIGNPTVEAMETAVAQLEGGTKAIGCGSGMAAVNTLFAALLNTGDHVVCSKVVYGSTFTILKTLYSKFGIKVSFVDSTDLQAVEKAIIPETRLVYIETPGNPTIGISDIKKIADLAHKNGAKLAVDNTFLSPCLQQPFSFGADIVLHSLTKFLNGHADVIGGVLVSRDEETWQALKTTMNQTGGILSPFDAFLVHRGIQTLSLRMQRHCENGLSVAQFLESHSKISWVRYPGLKSHPQYELGQRQHKGPGGLMAFELKGGHKAGQMLLDSVKLCSLAVSLGGVETLIQHPASMTHAAVGKVDRKSAGVTDGLIRLSVGIENDKDIIDDLTCALSAV